MQASSQGRAWDRLALDPSLPILLVDPGLDRAAIERAELGERVLDQCQQLATGDLRRQPELGERVPGRRDNPCEPFASPATPRDEQLVSRHAQHEVFERARSHRLEGVDFGQHHDERVLQQIVEVAVQTARAKVRLENIDDAVCQPSTSTGCARSHRDQLVIEAHAINLHANDATCDLAKGTLTSRSFERASAGTLLIGSPRVEHEGEQVPLDEGESLANRLARALRYRQARVLAGAETTPIMVDRFEVLETLGSGGMGQVYAAHDTRLGRRVAIKICQLAEEHEALALEARALAKLSHPNIVAVHEVLPVEGEHVLVMEYVEGQTLRAWAAATAPSWRELLERFLDAGRALEAVHAAGLQHGDFKPDNVMIDNAGRVRVIDFGVARHTREVVVEDKVKGTLVYLPPERLIKEHPRADSGERLDVFSFCVSIWELLYGVRPFDILDLIIGEPGDEGLPMKVIPLGLPGGIEDVLRRGLAMDPRARWPSIAAVCAALAEVMEDRATRAARLHRRVAMVAFVGLSMATVVMGLALMLEPAPQPEAASLDDLEQLLVIAERNAEKGDADNALRLLDVAWDTAQHEPEDLRRVARTAVEVGDRLAEQGELTSAAESWDLAIVCYREVGDEAAVQRTDEHVADVIRSVTPARST